jgi:hypothetical protein
VSWTCPKADEAARASRAATDTKNMFCLKRMNPRYLLLTDDYVTGN